jgi:hypothetical protein
MNSYAESREIEADPANVNKDERIDCRAPTVSSDNVRAEGLIAVEESESGGAEPPAVSAAFAEAQLDANWVTLADGTVAPGRILIFPGKDGTYEVEYGGAGDSSLVGLSVGVSFESNHTVIQEISLDSSLAKMTMRVGDILISVNNRDVIYEDLEDIIAFIDMIRCAFALISFIFDIILESI